MVPEGGRFGEGLGGRDRVEGLGCAFEVEGFGSAVGEVGFGCVGGCAGDEGGEGGHDAGIGGGRGGSGPGGEGGGVEGVGGRIGGGGGLVGTEEGGEEAGLVEVRIGMEEVVEERTVERVVAGRVARVMMVRADILEVVVLRSGGGGGRWGEVGGRVSKIEMEAAAAAPHLNKHGRAVMLRNSDITTNRSHE